MTIKTKGVVIKLRNIGEKDAIITLLTPDHGVIEASARGVKSVKSKIQSAVQPLCFSDFTLYKGRSGYIVNDAEGIESFYDIRLDVEKFSLASYFCETISYVQPSDEGVIEIMKLLLNSLYVMSKSLCSDIFVKSVFEFKFMCESGFCPNMDCCAECGNADFDSGIFLLSQGNFVCADCASGYSGEAKAEINESVIKTLRFIAENESKKIFSLHIGKNLLEYISKITEFYLIYHCGHNFKSLDFYKNIKNKM